MNSRAEKGHMDGGPRLDGTGRTNLDAGNRCGLAAGDHLSKGRMPAVNLPQRLLLERRSIRWERRG